MGQLDLRIADKYRLQRRIGGGSFGAVYIATCIKTGEEVAIKLEYVSIYPSLLEGEFDTYRSLAGGPGIPNVRGMEEECDFRAMIFDLLGPSLEDLFNFCRRKFSLKTVLMLADQLLDRLSHIHLKDVIHRDIKPENFLMGVKKLGNQVYVTDLGLATEPGDVQVKDISDPNQKLNLIGTAYYASINGHLGVMQSYCDDLESLGYMLVHFMLGSLPWKGLKAANKKEKAAMILERKRAISTQDLCEGLPKEFRAYFDYTRALPADEKPNYSFLRKNFQDLFVREGFEYDNVYDWTILKYLIANQ
ncbi:MAG: hypothetical protein Q9209_001884 [Squamulea sp. 1 TL-2023]